MMMIIIIRPPDCDLCSTAELFLTPGL